MTTRKNQRSADVAVANLEKIFGLHAVESALRNDPTRVLSVLVRKGRQDQRIAEIMSLAKSAGIRLKQVDAMTFDKEAGKNRHQGVLAEYETPKTRSEDDLYALLESIDHPPFLLILDGVTDPHNLGACLRTADAAGVDAVVVPRDNAVGITPVVRNVACGAAESLPFIQVTNLSRFLDTLRDDGFWVVGTSDKAEKTLYETDLKGSLVVVMGAEGKGMRRLTTERCDFLVSLPMAGEVSSLNVSVATGVCLFEAVRQRSLG